MHIQIICTDTWLYSSTICISHSHSSSYSFLPRPWDGAQFAELSAGRLEDTQKRWRTQGPWGNATFMGWNGEVKWGNIGDCNQKPMDLSNVWTNIWVTMPDCRSLWPGSNWVSCSRCLDRTKTNLIETRVRFGPYPLEARDIILCQNRSLPVKWHRGSAVTVRHSCANVLNLADVKSVHVDMCDFWGFCRAIVLIYLHFSSVLHMVVP